MSWLEFDEELECYWCQWECDLMLTASWGIRWLPERFICPLEIKQRPQLVQISSSGFKNEACEWCENHVLNQYQENKLKALWTMKSLSKHLKNKKWCCRTPSVLAAQTLLLSLCHISETTKLRASSIRLHNCANESKLIEQWHVSAIWWAWRWTSSTQRLTLPILRWSRFLASSWKRSHSFSILESGKEIP